MNTLKNFFINQEEDTKPFDLHKIQPELIQAKSTLEKVLSRLCKDNNLAEEIHKASGDSLAVSIWYLGQAINYLERLIVNTK